LCHKVPLKSFFFNFHLHPSIFRRLLGEKFLIFGNLKRKFSFTVIAKLLGDKAEEKKIFKMEWHLTVCGIKLNMNRLRLCKNCRFLKFIIIMNIINVIIMQLFRLTILFMIIKFYGNFSFED